MYPSADGEWTKIHDPPTDGDKANDGGVFVCLVDRRPTN